MKYMLKPLVVDVKQIQSDNDYDGFEIQCNKDYWNDRCEYCHDGYCQDYKYDEKIEDYTDERIYPNCKHRIRVGYVYRDSSINGICYPQIGDYIVTMEIPFLRKQPFTCMVKKEDFEKFFMAIEE